MKGERASPDQKHLVKLERSKQLYLVTGGDTDKYRTQLPFIGVWGYGR